MGFKEFFRLTKGKLWFIGVIALLIGLFIIFAYFSTAIDFSQGFLLVSLPFVFLVLFGVLFPVSLMAAFLPAHFDCYTGCTPSDLIGWVVGILFLFVFWYLISCVFSWIIRKVRAGREQLP